MLIAIEKTLGPTQILEYLSLILDFVKQLVGTLEKKMKKCLELVSKLILTHISGAKTMVKAIQKMAGSLNFICQAIPAGKPFLASFTGSCATEMEADKNPVTTDASTRKHVKI